VVGWGASRGGTRYAGAEKARPANKREAAFHLATAATPHVRERVRTRTHTRRRSREDEKKRRRLQAHAHLHETRSSPFTGPALLQDRLLSKESCCCCRCCRCFYNASASLPLSPSLPPSLTHLAARQWASEGEPDCEGLIFFSFNLPRSLLFWLLSCASTCTRCRCFMPKPTNLTFTIGGS
jgi:hypothetical protein